jgi:hypothetical protein
MVLFLVWAKAAQDSIIVDFVGRQTTIVRTGGGAMTLAFRNRLPEYGRVDRGKG